MKPLLFALFFFFFFFSACSGDYAPSASGDAGQDASADAFRGNPVERDGSPVADTLEDEGLADGDLAVDGVPSTDTKLSPDAALPPDAPVSLPPGPCEIVSTSSCGPSGRCDHRCDLGETRCVPAGDKLQEDACTPAPSTDPTGGGDCASGMKCVTKKYGDVRAYVCRYYCRTIDDCDIDHFCAYVLSCDGKTGIPESPRVCWPN